MQVKLSIATEDKLIAQSSGEVTHADTIDVKTMKPLPGGLFCERIFGPQKSYTCSCGRHAHKSATVANMYGVCEVCGVELIHSNARRVRMGHINLSAPVVHPWHKRLVSKILQLSTADFDKLLGGYHIVVDPGSTDLSPLQVLDSGMYYEYEDSDAVMEISTRGIWRVLSSLDVEEPLEYLTGKALRGYKDLLNSGRHPRDLLLRVLPVLSPDHRPLVRLQDGRLASNDLNDLYRAVILTNQRVSRSSKADLPDLVIKNELQLLQKTIDQLFDNGMSRTKPGQRTNSRGAPLMGLTARLKGKDGILRRNSLGKRVDYSGRSVITSSGEELELDQVGIPRKMALELFKPHIIHILIRDTSVVTHRAARKMIERVAEGSAVEQEHDLVHQILEIVTRDHPVMLNRAPTLHRLSFRSFYPVLHDGNAILLHPLACAGFNADYDGDQMAVHVPLSKKAVEETRAMLASHHILSPASGKTTVNMSQEMVLGLRFLTHWGEGSVSSETPSDVRTPEELVRLLSTGEVNVHDAYVVRVADPDSPAKAPTYKRYKTTVGRCVLWAAIPNAVESLSFDDVNKVINKKDSGLLIERVFQADGSEVAADFANTLMRLGFKWGTYSGCTIGITDLKTTPNKKALLEKGFAKDAKLRRRMKDDKNYTFDMYRVETTKQWAEIQNRVVKETFDLLSVADKGLHNIWMMMDSGARGSRTQVRQLTAMRGLMAKPNGEIIPTPIVSNLREGMTAFEYWMSTHGARKGLVDTALMTAKAGHLTRRVVDVAQDIVITMEDCGTTEGVEVTRLPGADFAARLYGRVLAQAVLQYPAGYGPLTRSEAQEIAAGAETAVIRTPALCQTPYKCCQKCYGMDPSTQELVEMGTPVGVLAGQSIGEPGTQLTLRTFHTGGAVGRGKDNLVTVRSQHAGTLEILHGESPVDGRIYARTTVKVGKITYDLPAGAEVPLKDTYEVGDVIAHYPKDYYVKFAGIKGIVKSLDSIFVTKRGHTRETGSMMVIEDSAGGSHNIYIPRWVTYGINVIVGDKVTPKTELFEVDLSRMSVGDITGGLPKVDKLLEASKTENPAPFSSHDGTVQVEEFSGSGTKIHVTPDDPEVEPYSVTVSADSLVAVETGDWVSAGTSLVVGQDVDSRQVYKKMGRKAALRFIVDGVQNVYRDQGVFIDDKHVELVVGRMLNWVKVIGAPEGAGIGEDPIPRERLLDLTEEELENVTAIPVLNRITASAEASPSWLSAASFQNTKKVLHEAALRGKTDTLQGLKESVICGQPIPAGTGFRREDPLPPEV